MATYCPIQGGFHHLQPLGGRPGRVRRSITRASSCSGGGTARQEDQHHRRGRVWKTGPHPRTTLRNWRSFLMPAELRRPSAAGHGCLQIATAAEAQPQALGLPVIRSSLISSCLDPGGEQPAQRSSSDSPWPGHRPASGRIKALFAPAPRARKHLGPLSGPIGGTLPGVAVVHSDRRGTSSPDGQQQRSARGRLTLPGHRLHAPELLLGQAPAGSLLLLHVVCEGCRSRPASPQPRAGAIGRIETAPGTGGSPSRPAPARLLAGIALGVAGSLGCKDQAHIRSGRPHAKGDVAPANGPGGCWLEMLQGQQSALRIHTA